MAGGTILALATYPAETMKQILSGTWSSTFFCTSTFTGSVIGNPADFTHYHNPKCLYPLRL